MKKCEKVWKCVKKCQKVWKSAKTILPFSCCPLVFLWKRVSLNFALVWRSEKHRNFVNLDLFSDLLTSPPEFTKIARRHSIAICHCRLGYRREFHMSIGCVCYITKEGLDLFSDLLTSRPEFTKIARSHSLAIFHCRLGYRKEFHNGNRLCLLYYMAPIGAFFLYRRVPH